MHMKGLGIFDGPVVSPTPGQLCGVVEESRGACLPDANLLAAV